MEAIVYCAGVASPRFMKLLEELILLRDLAMHPRGGPPDKHLGDTENTEILEEMVTNFDLSNRELTEDSPMPYSGTLSITRLPDFTGLLNSNNIGGYSVYLVPPT